MTLSNAPLSRMSPAEYLEWERMQRDKHQLLHGEVYASRFELTTGTILVVDEIFEGAFDLPGDA